MKDKDIENMLKAEIRDVTPNVLPCILSSLPQKEVKKKSLPFRKLLFSAACVLLCVAIGFGSFALWSKKTTPGGLTFQGGGYVCIDINPSVQFTLDTNGKVKSVMPLNADARVLLKNKKLVGKTIATASTEVITYALELGYMKVDKKNNAVLLSASCEKQDEEIALKKALATRLENSMKEKGIYGVVITENKKSQDAKNAAEHGISQSKYTLIQSALSIGAIINETDYSSISIASIYELIEKRTEYLEDFDFNEAFEDVHEENEKQLEEVLERVEPFIEALEDASDKLPDKEKELVESALDEMKELLDEERHIKAQEIKNVMQRLKGIAEIENKVTELEAALSEMLSSISLLEKNLQEQMQREIEYRQSRYNENSANYNSHEKENDFDKNYKNWAGAFKEYCENDWGKAKLEWEKDNESI